MDCNKLSWVAGFLDGEGTIRIAREKRIGKDSAKNYRYIAAISVVNTHEDSVKLVRDMLAPGTSIWSQKRGTYRKVYRWGISGNRRVVEVLEKILPHLVTKKSQAKKVIEFCKRAESQDGRFRGKGLTLEELGIRENFFIIVKTLNGTLVT